MIDKLQKGKKKVKKMWGRGIAHRYLSHINNSSSGSGALLYLQHKNYNDTIENYLNSLYCL
jgi:hypothetical protein